MTLLDTYDDHDFDEQAVSRIASTFDSSTARLVATGSATDRQEFELVKKWYFIAEREGITDNDAKAALVMQGAEMYYEDALERTLAELADHFETDG